jgi:hypothetical protein
MSRGGPRDISYGADRRGVEDGKQGKRAVRPSALSARKVTIFSAAPEYRL